MSDFLLWLARHTDAELAARHRRQLGNSLFRQNSLQISRSLCPRIVPTPEPQVPGPVSSPRVSPEPPAPNAPAYVPASPIWDQLPVVNNIVPAVAPSPALARLLAAQLAWGEPIDTIEDDKA